MSSNFCNLDFYKSVLAGTMVACADFKHAVLHDALLI
jgi:hypothetical protein